MNRGLVKVAVALAVFGAAILIFGGALLDLMGLPSAPASDSVVVTGTVVDTPTFEDDVCSPVVEYTVEGQTYSVESPIATGPCPYEIGDPAEVSYSPSDPGRAQLVGDFATGQLVKVIFVVIGVAMVASAAVLVVISLVRARR